MIASAKKPVALILALLMTMVMVAPAVAVEPAPGAFFDTWARTDKPVADDVVDRTWIWGPEANTEVMQEPYAESPGGMRDVQYFDKSRMEINDPDAVNDGLWYVTNGLLVVELMSGMMQVGDDEFEERSPAEINIVGDPGYEETPTYADYADLQGTPAFADGSVITATVDGDGNVGNDESLDEWNVTAGELAGPTGHRTASVFWDFMVSSGTVYEDGDFVEDRLFENAYYATGYPITEAYWSQVMLAGSEQWVLTQAFERRVMTYAPNNNEGFQVEAGNVGLHYYEWRYETDPPPPPGPDPVELTDQVLYTELSGDNEVPPVETDATGSAFVWVTEDGSLHFQVMVADIVDVTAAHIHLAPAGENGPVVVPLFSGDFSGDGVLAEGTITAEMLANDLEGMSLEILMAHMVAGNTYVNVHTDVNKGGEIRGQLMLTDMEPPPPPPAETQTFHVMFGALNDSGVSGTATLTLEGDQLTVMIEASGLEADAEHLHHIHGADVDYSVCPTPDMADDELDDDVLSITEGAQAYGGVRVDLQPYSMADAEGNISFNETFTLEDPTIDLTAHTIILHGMTVDGTYEATVPVACGVIMPEDSFTSDLSGDNVLPEPVESEGSGFATYHMTADGSAIIWTLVVNDLDDVTAAHIHLIENEGEDTGGVVVPLFDTDVEGGVASNGILSSGVITADDLINALEGMTLEDLLTALESGEAYTNVHTGTVGSGEIRGQIMPMAGEDHMH